MSEAVDDALVKRVIAGMTWAGRIATVGKVLIGVGGVIMSGVAAALVWNGSLVYEPELEQVMEPHNYHLRSSACLDPEGRPVDNCTPVVDNIKFLVDHAKKDDEYKRQRQLLERYDRQYQEEVEKWELQSKRTRGPRPTKSEKHKDLAARLGLREYGQ